ncbi:MAG TPA: cupin-like domain-containing protein, partial [Rhodanobacteraceae bacterium]|nr:cupin-like domain-containing protein [Rhodanobacteraceae bacterium]
LGGAGRDSGDSLGALFHAILAYRDLPRRERANWQRLLDHYVFADEHPLPHVPAGRHGVLGSANPATLQRLRRQARAHLRDEGAD